MDKLLKLLKTIKVNKWIIGIYHNDTDGISIDITDTSTFSEHRVLDMSFTDLEEIYNTINRMSFDD